MARPRSDEKQLAILKAATQVIAISGPGASTKLMAKAAGVSEGTVFRYFPNKDALLNAVFRHLVQDLRATVEGIRGCGSVEERARSSWDGYVDWGISNPEASRALNQLALSDRITPATQASGDAFFPELLQLSRVRADSVLGGCSPAFLSEALVALANAASSFGCRHPEQAHACKVTAFLLLCEGMKEPASDDLPDTDGSTLIRSDSPPSATR